MARRRRRRWLLGVIALIIATLIGLTFPLFVFPELNSPEHADAIVVLGGSGAGPLERGYHLAADGYANLLVFSLVPSQHCSPSILPKVTVRCFRPQPQSTQGEAEAIEKLASADHWHRILVVMPTTQASRARLRIERCYHGPFLEIGVPPTGLWGWVVGVMYEWPALIKALVLQPDC
jgi:hypothetical protein